jgi:hypothetical protein
MQVQELKNTAATEDVVAGLQQDGCVIYATLLLNLLWIGFMVNSGPLLKLPDSDVTTLLGSTHNVPGA